MRLLKRLPTLAMGVVVVVWFLVLRPVGLGGPAGYEIVAGKSMEPLLHTGDLVITHAQAAYGINDLIVFRVPSGQIGAGDLIVHRIIGGDATSGFDTKGDNNPSPDSWHPKAVDVVGRSWIELPGSGGLLLILRRPLVIATLLGSLAGLWIFTSGSGPSSATKPGVAGGLTVWGRRSRRQLGDATEANGHPIPSLTPVQDMRDRNARRLDRR